MHRCGTHGSFFSVQTGKGLLRNVCWICSFAFKSKLQGGVSSEESLLSQILNSTKAQLDGREGGAEGLKMEIEEGQGKIFKVFLVVFLTAAVKPLTTYKSTQPH